MVTSDVQRASKGVCVSVSLALKFDKYIYTIFIAAPYILIYVEFTYQQVHFY